MKSNYIMSRTEAKRIADEAARQQKAELMEEAYHLAARDIAEQLTATHLYVLHERYGFGKKRLTDFLDEVNWLNSIMMNPGLFPGKALTPDDVKEYMERVFGLDLTIKELTIERDSNRKRD